jgi:hypothetical protein
VFGFYSSYLLNSSKKLNGGAEFHSSLFSPYWMLSYVLASKPVNARLGRVCIVWEWRLLLLSNDHTCSTFLRAFFKSDDFTLHFYDYKLYGTVVQTPSCIVSSLRRDFMVPRISAKRCPPRNIIGRQSRVFQARCQLLCLRVNRLPLAPLLDTLVCTLTATSLRLRTWTSGVQMKS